MENWQVEAIKKFENWQVEALEKLEVKNAARAWELNAAKWSAMGDWWENQLAEPTAAVTDAIPMESGAVVAFLVPRYLRMLASLREKVGDVDSYARKRRKDSGRGYTYYTVPEVSLHQMAKMLTLVALEFGAECWRESWIGIREKWDPPSVGSCARAMQILEHVDYSSSPGSMPSVLRRIVNLVARTEQDKSDLAETRSHIRHGWEEASTHGWDEASPEGSMNTLLLHVVGKGILGMRNTLSGPDVAWRWPIAITAAALDFALTVPGMRLSVCGDTLVCTPGTCEERLSMRLSPKTMAKGGVWAPLDETGLGELHAARARISLCMREKDVAPLSLGVACAMTPLLAKDDYRPSKKPEVASVDGEIFYRLSNRTMLEGEGKNTRKTHAPLVDGLEAAARSKRGQEQAPLSPINQKPAAGGCVLL